MSASTGKTWAKRSAATLARRLRRERVAQQLSEAATDAAECLPHKLLAPDEQQCIKALMLDYGMAKLDHWALDTFNEVHLHCHGEALDTAAPCLSQDLISDLRAVKKRGDAARHCAGPTFDFADRTACSHSEVLDRLDTLGTMVASLQIGLLPCSNASTFFFNPAADEFFPGQSQTMQP